MNDRIKRTLLLLVCLGLVALLALMWMGRTDRQVACSGVVTKSQGVDPVAVAPEDSVRASVLSAEGPSPALEPEGGVTAVPPSSVEQPVSVLSVSNGVAEGASTLGPGALADPDMRAKYVRLLELKAAAEQEAVQRRAAREGWTSTSNVQAVRDGRVFEKSTLNANAGISAGANLVRRTAPYDLTGSGVRVGLWDESMIRTNHQELRGRVIVGDLVGYSDHMTHVAGTIGASGVVASAIGMAPSVKLESYDWYYDDSEAASRAMAVANNTNDVHVSNHSYGYLAGWVSAYFPPRWYGTFVEGATNRESDLFGQYESDSRTWDQICYAAPYYLPCRAAGNDRTDPAPSAGATFQYYRDGYGWASKSYVPGTDPGSDYWDNGGYDTVLPVGTAKNVLTVGCVSDAVSGGARSVGAAAMSSWSGWGPADDGRIKPDIVANGESVYSSSSSSDISYTTKSGTSMATPGAVGCLALLAEHHRRQMGISARSSTLKGLFIHTADDRGNAGPDYQYGWGLLNVKAAADMVSEQAQHSNLLRVVESALTVGTTQRVYSLVWDRTNAIRTTLCWTDPPGASRVVLDDPAPALVNDLDLRVTDPNGRTFYPFVLDRLQPAQVATNGDNAIDNVEQVLIAAPTSGVYTITVRHKGTLQDSRQDFSLMVSGGTYFPIIGHTPLISTLQTTGTYRVDVTVETYSPLNTGDLWVVWSTSGGAGPFSSNALTWVSNTVYSGTIPAQTSGTRVYYYLSVTTSNGLTSVYPDEAPVVLNEFSVGNPVQLSVFGSPEDYGEVTPSYGVSAMASGLAVQAAAPAYANTNATSRWACVGWIGNASVPAAGGSNTVAFTLTRNSFLAWQWRQQFSLSQASTPAGVVNAQTWWDTGSVATTVVAAAQTSITGAVYRFVEWQIDGARSVDGLGAGANPAGGIAMSQARTALVVYVQADLDADADGLPDWWERYYFGSATAASAVVDSDGDGYRNSEEYADGSHPRDAGSVPVGPVIAHTPLADPQVAPAPWTVTAVVTDNFAVASVSLRWRRVPLSWRTLAMQTNDMGLYEAAIPAPGMFGDQYEYRIEATDSSGNLTQSSTHDFSVAYPVTEVSPAALSNRVLFGGQVLSTLCITNSGNAPYDWILRIQSVGLFDDMEQGTNGWSHGGAGDTWHIDGARSASASNAWYCGSNGRYGDGMHAWLNMPTQVLGVGASLTFTHWMASELYGGAYTWDGGIIEISTNGGLAYQQLTPVGGYPYLIFGHSESPWVDDTPCFGGAGGWQQVAVDLSSYAGATALIRFHFGSDGYTVDEGWYIDDVRITPTSGTNTWLTLGATNGMLAAGQSVCVTATMNSASLAPGTGWYAYAVLSGNDPVAASRVIPVSFYVQGAPHAEIVWVGQATNGSGWVTVSNRVSDVDGEVCSAEVAFSVDGGGSWCTAQVVSAVMAFGGVPGVQSQAMPQVTGVATTNGVGVATNALSVVWASAAGVPGVTLCTQTLVRVRVYDGAYWGAATSTAFLVDNEGPSTSGVPVVSSHLPGVWTTNRVFAVAWDAASDGAGVGVAGYRLGGSEQPGAVVTSVALPGMSSTLAVPHDGSNWYVSVSAIDAYGNTGGVVQIGPYWIDATPPSAAAASVSVSGGYVVGPWAQGTWGGFTDVLSGVAGYYVALADGGGTTNGFVVSGVTTASLAGCVLDATNRFLVWAYDAAGGIGLATGATFMAFDPQTDFDGDGMPSGDEWIAGTGPGDRYDVFGIVAMTSTVAGLVLEWDGRTGRWYSVAAATDLPLADWGIVPDFSNQPGLAGRMAYTSDVSLISNRFYRIVVSQ